MQRELLLGNLSLTNAVWGISLSGTGSHSFANTTVSSTERNLDATGTGLVTLSEFVLTGADKSVSLRGPNSDFTDGTVNNLHLRRSCYRRARWGP